MASNAECPVHNKKVKFYCAQCSKLVCTKCAVGEHQGHVFKEIGGVQKERVERLKTRKIEAWTEARRYAKQLDEYDSKEKKIHAFFEDSHRALMLDERKLTKPILVEKEKIEERLAILHGEIDYITAIEILADASSSETAIIPPTPQPQSYSYNAPSSDFHALSSTSANASNSQGRIGAIQKMSRLDFRLMVEKYAEVGDFVTKHRYPTLQSDTEITLMSALERYDADFKRLSEIEGVRFDFKYNNALMQKVLNDLKETYELVINDLTDDRGFVKKYQEECSISYIFSMCGMENTIHLSHVEQYDISGQRWGSSEPAKMKRACSSASVEGLNPYQLVNNIEAFNTKDSSSTILFTFGGNERVEGCCFDKREYIYFITNSIFCRFSVLTKTIHKLANCPLKEGKFGLSLVFGFNEGFKVFVIGGKDNSQYYYNIDLGSWHEMPKKTKQTYFHGAVGVRTKF
eukprot:gene17463-20837_t